MRSLETIHFIHSGFGWHCKHCLAENEAGGPSEKNAKARYYTEGEAEEKELRMAAPFLARWRDASRRTLYCPQCSVEETISNT